ncbi:hypothetical protein [Xanthomonas phage X1]|nr:hypothetical protein [Xanthomonas phage X1]
MSTLNSPAHTYARPSGAVNSVRKMHVERGGEEVRFVIGKDPATGRYFPVFIDRIKQVSDQEIMANPSANQTGRAKKRASARKAPAKKAAKKATKRTTRKNTLH